MDSKIQLLEINIEAYVKDHFGTKYIFGKRAKRYKRYIKLLQIFGLLVPSVLAVTAITYFYNSNFLLLMAKILTALTIVQFLISFLAFMLEWDAELAYSFEAVQAHDNLHDKFQKLSNFHSDNYQEFKNEFDVLNATKKERDQQDLKHGAKDWELRKGMRAALRHYQKPCAACGKIPYSMESTDCPVCGRFSRKYKLKSFFGYE